MSTAGHALARNYTTKHEPVTGKKPEYIPCPKCCGLEWTSQQKADKCCRELK